MSQDDTKAEQKAHEEGDLKPKSNGKGVKKVFAIEKSQISILNAAAALDGCDEQLLPASFRALERDLHFSPAMLGSFTLCQSLACSLSAPVWGMLADRYSRKRILAVGCMMWGTITLLLSHASDYPHIIALRGLNGMALASVGPTSQSILADVIAPEHRGHMFGWVQLAHCAGRLVGGVGTTSISNMALEGMAGWRLAFAIVGIVSILMGIFIELFLEEIPRKTFRIRAGFLATCPRRSQPAAARSSALDQGSADTLTNRRRASANTGDSGGTGDSESALDAETQALVHRAQADLQWSWQGLGRALQVPSIWVIVGQGLFGSIPWSATTFMTMWYQYCGIMDVEAALLIGLAMVGGMIAGPLGGWIGDRAFRWSNNHGRVLVAQFSILMKIPILSIVLLVLPKTPASFGSFAACAFLIGTLAGWAGVAVNRPILAEVVPPTYRATVFAMVACFEGASAALLGAPLVGLLAEQVFGYTSSSVHIRDMDEELRINNATALAKALYCLTAGPYFLSFCLYGLLHVTLPTDRNNAKNLMRLMTDSESIDETSANNTVPAAAGYGAVSEGITAAPAPARLGRATGVQEDDDRP